MALGLAEINVETIRIIVKKEEAEPFSFYNHGKKEDGFVLFTEGSPWFLRRDRDPVRLSPGTLVLLRRGDDYGFRCEPPCSYVTAAFSFSSDSEETLNTLPTVLRCPQDLQSKILETEKLWQQRQRDCLITCRIGILQLYVSLLRSTRPHAVSASARLAEAAKEYVRGHFKENFKTEDVAAFCQVSPSHLRAVFGRETGTSLLEYRNGLRTDAAREMLSSGLFSVKETAEELGFCDVYYFSKTFKQITGVSPGAFRWAESRKDVYS